MVLRPDEGGAFRHVADLSRGVVGGGHDVAVCGPLAHRTEQLSVEVLPVEMIRPIAPRQDLRCLREVIRAVRDWRPDLIHAHGSKGSVYARAGRFSYPRVPVLYTPHGYPFAGYFTEPGARRRYRLIERLLSPLATRVVCVCEAERRLACSVGPASRTRVVYNGTPPDPPREVAAAVGELRARGPVVAAVTGLRPGKGVETLLEAWRAVAAGHPDAALAIAGGGSERERIVQLRQRLGLAGSVHLLGELASGDTVLAGADAFVNPSWAESFPYAVLEAMSFGLPIVATDVGGTGEAIEDGVSGRLVAARDPAALASGIDSALADRQRAASMGERARRRHSERFTTRAMVRRTLDVYGEVGIGAAAS